MMGGEYEFIPARAGEANVTLADITKTKSLLKWNPIVQLEDWIKENNPN